MKKIQIHHLIKNTEEYIPVSEVICILQKKIRNKPGIVIFCLNTVKHEVFFWNKKDRDQNWEEIRNLMNDEHVIETPDIIFRPELVKTLKRGTDTSNNPTLEINFNWEVDIIRPFSSEESLDKEFKLLNKLITLSDTIVHQ